MKVCRIISSTLYLSSVVLLMFMLLLVATDPILLSSFLPQLVSIHQTCRALADSNTLLGAKILEGLQNNNKTKLVQQNQYSISANLSSLVSNISLDNKNSNQTLINHTNKIVNYEELEGFNKWVGDNLEYAIKNTLATAEALKEEALENNGTVDYSLRFIEDAQLGIKYWQSAVLFQDKTLKNEKFEIDSI